MQLCGCSQRTCICCFNTFCRRPGACGLAPNASSPIGTWLIALCVLGLCSARSICTAPKAATVCHSLVQAPALVSGSLAGLVLASDNRLAVLGGGSYQALNMRMFKEDWSCLVKVYALCAFLLM